LVYELLFKKMFGGGAPDQALVEKLDKKVHATWAVMDKHLEGKKYLVGDHFTIAGNFLKYKV
jgi:glutathione S-transferase